MAVIEADRDKLIKCLRMFSSDFDGEVASAARRAHELVSSRKFDWDDLIIRPGSARSRDMMAPGMTGDGSTNNRIAPLPTFVATTN
jgi:hypothetical protein